jgi:Heterokaryon incompatibility protein (HET)
MDPTTSRLENLEARMTRLEAGLNAILGRLAALPQQQRPNPSTSAPAPPQSDALALALQLSAQSTNLAIPPIPLGQPEEPADELKSGPYPYTPLGASKTQTRILVLRDGTEDAEPIRCKLVHLDVDHRSQSSIHYTLTDRSLAAAATSQARRARAYDALSYTWGKLDKKGEIILEGHRFPVTQNLETALRQIRRWRRLKGMTKYAQGESYWWVDAVCINQSDVEERNRQVGIMRQIYKSAKSVRVWLDAEEDRENGDGALAMAVVERMYSGVPKVGPGEPKPVYPEVGEEEKVRHWRALAALLERPWWERVWVRQEVALNRAVTVHSGDDSCGWEVLMGTVEWLNKFVNRMGFDPLQAAGGGEPVADTGGIHVPFYCKVDLLKMVKDQVRSGDKYMDFKDLIFHTRFCRSTDLRDKVFAVLGLADPEDHKLEADYRLPVQEAYKAAARSLISATKNLDLLGACQNPERLHGLPSWVPNLQDNWKAWPFKPENGLHDVSPASGADYSFKDPDILQVRGSILDSVKTMSEGRIEHNDTFEQLAALLQTWKDFAATVTDDPDAEYLEKEFVKDHLLGKENERGWMKLLSIGHDAGHNLRYSDDKVLLPRDTSQADRYPHMRLAKSLLFPDGVKENAYIGIYNHLRRNGFGRRLSLGKKGTIGLVPADAQPGDFVCLLTGAKFPYLLRKKGRFYVVVGEACKSLFHFPVLSHLAIFFVEGVLFVDMSDPDYPNYAKGVAPFWWKDKTFQIR